MSRAKSAKHTQSEMERRRHGQILEVEKVLNVWTNEQKHGIHISLTLVMSFAKEFSLLEILRNRRRQTLRSLQKRKCMALHWS